MKFKEDTVMLKTAILNAIPSGIASALLSFLAAMYLIPFPETVFANAMNNGISGLLSGFVGSIVTLVVFIKKTEQQKQ